MDTGPTVMPAGGDRPRQEWPCRAEQLQAIRSHVAFSPALGNIHVYGPACTGKTTLVRWALLDEEAVFAYLRPSDSKCSVPELLARVVQGWRSRLECSERAPASKRGSSASLPPLQTAADLRIVVAKLRQRCRKPFFVVLDPVEPSCGDMLAAALAVQSLAGPDITIMTVGRMHWAQLTRALEAGMPTPAEVHVPAFTLAEVTKLLHEGLLGEAEQLAGRDRERVLRSDFHSSRNLSDLVAAGQDSLAHASPQSLRSTLANSSLAVRLLLVAAWLASNATSAAAQRLLAPYLLQPHEHSSATIADALDKHVASQSSLPPPQSFSLEVWLGTFRGLATACADAFKARGWEGLERGELLESVRVMQHVAHLVDLALVTQVGSDALRGATYTAAVSVEIVKEIMAAFSKSNLMRI